MTWLNELPAAVLALLGTLLVGGPIAWVTHWLGQRSKREEGLAGLAERLTAATLARQDIELRELRSRLDVFEERFDLLKEHAAALATIIHQLVELVRHARDRVQPPPSDGWPPIPVIPKQRNAKDVTQ